MFRRFAEFLVRKNFESAAGTSRSFNTWRFFQQGGRSSSWRSTSSKKKCDSRVFFAFAAGFSFKDHGISDERFLEAEQAVDEFDAHNDIEHGWEVLREEKDFRALRRRIKGPRELYEYKCAGTYRDISPRSFLDAQNDLDYRTEWDGNILTLDMLIEDEEHELIRWVSKYPYPMYAREYVYVRRTWVSDDQQIVVVDSEVVPEDVVPSADGGKHVRVTSYTSRMAIRAHKGWDDHGLDYILTYADNPEANIPRYVYNWIVNQGGPYFLTQVHAAALKLENSGREIRSVLERILMRRSRKMRERMRKEAEEERQEEQEQQQQQRHEEQEEEVTEVGKKKEQHIISGSDSFSRLNIPPSLEVPIY